MKTVFAGVEQISSQQMLYALIILCLLLVILMLIAVFVQNKRAKVAESQAKNMTLFVQERLDLAAKQSEQSDKTAREELGAAMQSVNDAMMRMMGEMTRTQQGQMDMLGGQLRAAGHQDEERMERMRQTMDRRLSNYEDKLGGVDRKLEARLESSETHMARLCQTLEGGLQRINDENRAQLEMMRQIVDEKLNETVGGSFYQALSNLPDLVLIMDESHHCYTATGAGDSKPKCHAELDKQH